MRVAMVTPMPPESAIADVMIQAVPRMSETWELEVWCPTEPSYRQCPVPLMPYETPGAAVLEALRAFDLVIYVLGNSGWHSRILPLAQRLPGLVVLHDAAVTDLVRCTAIESDELEILVRHVEAYYDTQRADVMRSATGLVTPDEWLRFSAEVPLDDVALQGSLGVVVHSEWHARKVDGLTLGEVTVAPLPVPSTRLGFEENQSGAAARLLARLPEEAFLLVTLGAVNANRRVDLLLEAIAGDDGLRDVHLWAVGPSEDVLRRHLLDKANSLGLTERFSLTGRVSDVLLQEVLARADAAAALRDPVIEGQSASVLTQLLSGTPVIVYDHAHYSELPDDAVIKVPLDNAASHVREAVRRLVLDERGRADRGARGRDYVLRSRSGAAYAEALLSAGDRAQSALPLAHLSADLSERLRRLGLHREPAVLETVTDVAFELFDLA